MKGSGEDDEGESWLVFEFELLRHDPREWVVLTGNRVLVALLGFIALAAVLAGIVLSGLVPLQKDTPVLFLLFALVAANFTLIAIVTSLSQLILGQRLESPGEIREKIAETIAYREEVGRTIGKSVMPVQTDVFMLVLYRQVRIELQALDGLQMEGLPQHAREELATLVDDIRTHCDYVVDVLERPSSGVKHALFVSLSTDYESAVHQAWRLQLEHADALAEEAAEPLGRLVGTLQHIEVASRLIEAVFIESEVSELSRSLLYVGFPAQLAAVALALVYTAPGSEPPLPIPALRVLVPAVVAAGFAPFVLLSSYIIRLTVVAHRTADTFPFSSQMTTEVTVRENHES